MPKKTPKKPRTATKNAQTKTDSQTPKADRIVANVKSSQLEVEGFKIIADERSYSTRYVVDPKFLESTITAVQSSPRLAAACNFVPTEARDAIRFDAAFARAEKEAQRLVDGIHGARVTRYVAQIDGADQVLAVARGLARTDDALAAHVKAMSDDRKKRRKTSDAPKKKAAAKAKAEPATPKAPASPAPTA